MKKLTFNKEWVYNIMIEQFKVFMAKPMFNITLPPSEEVINNSDLMAL